MMTKVALPVGLLLVAVALVWADHRKENKVDSNGGFTLKAMLHSRHAAPHDSGEIYGKSWIAILLKQAPSGVTPQISGVFHTPFCDDIHTTGGAGIAAAYGSCDWYRGMIKPGEGSYKTFANGINVGSGKTKAVHDYAPARRTVAVAVPPEDKPTISWGGGGGPGNLTYDVLEGGEPMFDQDEEIVWSGLDPVWNVPPVPVLRITSSLEYQGAGIVRYVYDVENLTGVDRTFAFPEITSVAFPSGWSGTVTGYGAATTNVDDDPSDAVCVQHALGTLGIVGEPEVRSTFQVYAPTSRLATQVEVTVTSAGHDPQQGANIVRFELSEPAEGAVLYRVTNDDDETVEIVAELVGPLAASTTYDFEDPAFPAGVNAYSVKAGTGVNGHRSSEALVTNQ